MRDELARAMATRACIRCGSTDLDMPGLADGVVPETDNLNEFVCAACGLRAIPLEFDREEDLRAFQRSVAQRQDGA